MTSVAAVIKANALSAVIEQLTGARPIITDTGNGERLSFSPSDQILVRDWIDGQLSKVMLPSDVQIDYLPVILPIAIKRVLPFVLMVAGVGFILGRL